MSVQEHTFTINNKAIYIIHMAEFTIEIPANFLGIKTLS
jgi:hypothetical protein